MKIEQTIKECGRLTTAMMQDYQNEILTAIRNLEKGSDGETNPKLNVSFGFEIESRPEDVFAVKAKISFTEKKVTDTAVSVVDERQRALFEGENDDLAPRRRGRPPKAGGD